MYDATLKKFCSFFFFLVHRKNRFYVTVGLYSNRTKDVKMWQKHKLSTRLCLVCHFFVLNAFDIICDLFLSRLRVHGLYTSNERRLGSCILLP